MNEETVAMTKETANEIMPLTEEQIEKVLAQWQESGAERLDNFGASFSEEDYIAGAMSVFFALGCQDKMPASWAFFGLAGSSHFRKTEAQRRAHEQMRQVMGHASSVISLIVQILDLEQDAGSCGTLGQWRPTVVSAVQLIQPEYKPRDYTPREQKPRDYTPRDYEPGEPKPGEQKPDGKDEDTNE